MRPNLIHTCLLLLFLFQSLAGWVQQGIYVAPSAQVFVANDTITFGWDTRVDGNLGLASGSVLRFTGAQWRNGSHARLTHELGVEHNADGRGGELIFAARNIVQVLSGGYDSILKKGPRFCKLTIDNVKGLTLTGSGVQVVHELSLTKGSLYLNGQRAVVGMGHPGTISGFSARRFIVTGNEGLQGSLVREGIHQAMGPVVFPVGTRQGAYTPAWVQVLSQQPDDVLVSVTDQVRTELHHGFLLADQTVQKTWRVGQMYHGGQNAVLLHLQHNDVEEGPDFKRNKARTYIAAFRNNWDTVPPARVDSVSSLPGAAPISNTVHSRLLPMGIGQYAYFTKMALPDTSLRTEMNLYGYRVDAAHTQVSWGVQPEIDVAYYVVQRWLPHGRTPQHVDTVVTKASNRYSAKYLYYLSSDDNDYPGVTYYRLLIKHFNRPDAFSETIAVAGWAGEPAMHLWPNPTRGKVKLAIGTALPVAKIRVWTTDGKTLAELPVEGRRIIDVDLTPYAHGTYIIGILSPAGKLLGTEKVLRLQP